MRFGMQQIIGRFFRIRVRVKFFIRSFCVKLYAQSIRSHSWGRMTSCYRSFLKLNLVTTTHEPNNYNTV